MRPCVHLTAVRKRNATETVWLSVRPGEKNICFLGGFEGFVPLLYRHGLGTAALLHSCGSTLLRQTRFRSRLLVT
jgi:hypothetical protein